MATQPPADRPPADRPPADQPPADLERVVNLAEFEPLARERMDPAAFDYVSGGSWDELTLRANVAAWTRFRFRPRVLTDIRSTDLTTTLLGRPASMPIAVAPMAVHGIAHPDAEVATARAAAAAGVPFTLSTTSTRPIEEVAAAAPDAERWFQLYLVHDLHYTRTLVERATAAGYRAIVLTVDLPVVGYRDRDRRSGFVLTELGSLTDAPESARGQYAELTDQRALGLTWADLAEVRSWSPLPFVLKGILSADDAAIAVEHGVDAIVVSNHGARQLDRTPATADVLGEIVDAVAGRVPVWVDGGIRRGLDVAAALALGAEAVLVGRPIHWALATGGQAGVERALAILREELELALPLLGVSRPSEVTRGHLT
jgi:4-hydroxymandelate oxidase